jgi:hypothetical protein
MRGSVYINLPRFGLKPGTQGKDGRYHVQIHHEGAGDDPEDNKVWRVNFMFYDVTYETRKVCGSEMWAICMEAAPGEADLWIRTMLSEEEAEYVIRHYYTSTSVAHPEALRA